MDEHRKKRLRELIERHYEGRQAALVRELGCNKTAVSNWLNPKQPFGERAARNLAEKLHLPERYFEQGGDEARRTDAAGDLQPDEEALLAAYRQHPHEVRVVILRCADADTSTIDMNWLRNRRTLPGKSTPAKQSKVQGHKH